MSNKQMSRELVRDLVKFIREIPTRRNHPWNAREAMELFVQHTLVNLIDVGNVLALDKLGACVDRSTLGFAMLKGNPPAH